MNTFLNYADKGLDEIDKQLGEIGNRLAYIVGLNDNSTNSTNSTNLANSDLDNSAQIFHHIILDCDFPQRNNLGNESFKINCTGTIKDCLKKNNSNYVPIVYELNDAENICKKMIGWAMDKGTTENKTMPIFGAIILTFKKNANIPVENFQKDIKLHGRKDYEELLSEQKYDKSHIVNYYSYNGASKIKRGLISRNAINESQIVSMRYGYLLQTPLHLGLFLINSLPKFTEHDIKLLREILKKNGQEYLTNIIESNQSDQLNQSDQSDQSMNMISVNNIIPVLAIDNNSTTFNSILNDMSANSNQIMDINIMDINSVNSETSENIYSNSQDGGQYNKYIEEKNNYIKLKKIAKSKGLI